MLRPIYANIPDDIKALRQWVAWRGIARKSDPSKMTKVPRNAKPPKVTKIPYQPNGRKAKTNDPDTWSTFDAVCAVGEKFDGVGFVLIHDGQYSALDFDKCRCPAFDGVTPWANSLDTVLPEIADKIRKLNTYTEISPSGQGIRVLVNASLPVAGKRYGKIEAYQGGRYVTITGHLVDGFPVTIEHRQKALDDFYRDVFEAADNRAVHERDSQPGIGSDGWRDLLEKATKSNSGEHIKQLFAGDHSGYPSPSEADLALCAHLAFWFKADAAAIDAAFRESGLFRAKWDERHFGDGRTYGEATISKAISGCNEHYHGRAHVGGLTSTPPSDEWHEPIPFNDYSHLPEFPATAIPGVCGEMAQALSESCQVDPCLPSCMILASLSTALAGKVRIDLGSHTEPANVYVIAILGSGNRKSECVKQIAEPIYLYQHECQQALVPIIQGAASNMRVLEKRLDKYQKQAATADDPHDREIATSACHDVLKEMGENPVPSQKVFIVDDVTPEAIGQIMANNDERVSILSAEGGIFKLIAGLYNNGQANMDLFLKAHSGDFWSNNRIGREAKSMMRPTLTMGLAVQPDVVEEIGRNSEFRGRGLSARFLYAVGQSMAGYRTRQSTPVPTSIKDAYHKGIVALMSDNEPIELMLTPSAQHLWDEFYDEVELRLRPGSELEHLVDWGSKLPGAVARIAGLLHFADSADGFRGNLIQERTVRSACQIGWYYLEHAKAVFGMMQEDPGITMGKRILTFIIDHRPEAFKARDLFNHTNVQSMKEIVPGLNSLIERGFVREEDVTDRERRRGRPEAIRYVVNPKVYVNAQGNHPHNPQK